MIKPKLLNKPRASSEAGYTILEGIMAIVVVTVLLVAISPMIGFAAAVRMQAKRTQLASQAARSYISFAKSDEVDEDVGATGENAPGITYSIPFERTQSTDLSTIDPPGNNLDCDDVVGENDNGYCSNNKELYCVNFDDEPGCQNTSPVDMVVQPLARFRGDVDDEGNVVAGTVDYNRGYELAVRVYQASSFKNDVTLKAIDDNGNTEATSFIGRRDLPLIQITTSVPPQGDNLYSTFCADLGGCD